MKLFIDQNGKHQTMYDGDDFEAAGKGCGWIIGIWLIWAGIQLVVTLFFKLFVLADSFIYAIIDKLLPLKLWFYLSELDRWIGIWDIQIQKSIFIIAILSLLLFFLYRIWKKRMKPGKVKTIGKLWIGSNLTVLLLRLPLYIVISIYVGLVGLDDFHLYDSRTIEYVKSENGFYGNHSDATIDTYHSEIFDTKTVTEVNGVKYDDYIVVTSGEKPNSEETGYWVSASFDLYEKVDKILFIGSFMENMKIDETNPLIVKVKTGREKDEENIVMEKTFTHINQVEEFEADVKGAELVDIVISSDHEFNFGIFELKKFMNEDD